MAESIKDGTGTGKEAKVDAENRLNTASVTEPEDKHRNKLGKQWSLPFTTTPVGAGDYFFYIKNTGEADLAITDIRISCASAGEIVTVHHVSGTPTYAAGGNVSPVSKNLGEEASVSATIKYDTNTTGLTDEGEIYFITLLTANNMERLSTSANIIIPKGTAFALVATTGTASIKCTVSLVEYPVDL